MSAEEDKGEETELRLRVPTGGLSSHRAQGGPLSFEPSASPPPSLPPLPRISSLPSLHLSTCPPHISLTSLHSTSSLFFVDLPLLLSSSTMSRAATRLVSTLRGVVVHPEPHYLLPILFLFRLSLALRLVILLVIFSAVGLPPSLCHLLLSFPVSLPVLPRLLHRHRRQLRCGRGRQPR